MVKTEDRQVTVDQAIKKSAASIVPRKGEGSNSLIKESIRRCVKTESDRKRELGSN